MIILFFCKPFTPSRFCAHDFTKSFFSLKITLVFANLWYVLVVIMWLKTVWAKGMQSSSKKCFVQLSLCQNKYKVSIRKVCMRQWGAATSAQHCANCKLRNFYQNLKCIKLSRNISHRKFIFCCPQKCHAVYFHFPILSIWFFYN